MSKITPIIPKKTSKKTVYVLRSNKLYFYELITGKGIDQYSTWVAKKCQAFKIFDLVKANEWRDHIAGLEGLVVEVEKI